MANANTARKDGDKFQARQFWLKAARLLDPKSRIERVGFERGPKGLDDIFVLYSPGKEPKGHLGHPIAREYLQCKWHVSPGNYGYENLIEPEFINATAKSFLQRAFNAQVAHAPDGSGICFKLLTNWPVDQADKLRPIISNRSGSLKLEKLFDNKTDKSYPGTIRKAWREHLDITDAQLNTLVQTLAFGHVSDSLDELRVRLDETLSFVGLKRFSANESSLIYDDLPFEWMAQGRSQFDRNSFWALCESENLIGEKESEATTVFGIKSFEHAFDRLEDRCHDVLNLVPNFDERYIHDASQWAKLLYPQLSCFLHDAARSAGTKLCLALDAHSTLAFAAGTVLNTKSGFDIELEQRIQGRRIWSAQDENQDSSWAQLDSSIIKVNEKSIGLAVAVCVTHDIANDVVKYVSAFDSSISHILKLCPSTGPSAQVVKSGRHAFDLSEAIKDAIRASKREMPDCNKIHLFVAAPNAMCFFLGQQQIAIGSVELYEFDFDQQRDGSYTPSLALPIT